jgi:PQQ enzyme repeat
VSCMAPPYGSMVAIDVNKDTASGLVFIGAATDHRFRAFDAKTGRKLWEVEVPADAHTTPITYMGRMVHSMWLSRLREAAPCRRGCTSLTRSSRLSPDRHESERLPLAS